MPRRPPPPAKLTRPRLHGAVSRERLFRALDEAREQGRAVHISGPPGAGKTALVGTWLDARAIDSIWYQVDAADADPATFFHYLGEAARRYARGGGARLPPLTAEYLNDVRGFARRFFRALYARLPSACVVVLDNYQEVRPDGQFHELVSLAIEEAPPGDMVIAVSRTDPPAAHARLLANSSIALLEWADLRLTPEETARIVGRQATMPAGELLGLHQRCDGWAAGLALLLQARRGTRMTGPTADQISRERVFDYFATQVLASIPVRQRHTLAATALLPAFTGAMAAALSGDPGVGVLLEDLYRRHLFTYRVPGEQARYQYHALFREYLLDVLAAMPRAKQTVLRAHAARLLRDSGLYADAMDLFAAVADWDGLIELLQQQARALLAQGRSSVLSAAIARIPQERLHRAPWLLCLHGTAQLAAAPLAARESYSRAAQLADALGDAATRLRAAAGMIDSYLLEYSRVTEMDRWIEALECALQAEIDFPDADAELAVYGSLMTAINYRKMGSSFAGGCAARILALLEQATQAGVKLSAGVQAAVFQANTGQLDHAWRSLDALRAGLCDPGVTALPRALYWLTRLWCSILSADSQAGRAALAALDDIEQREGLRTAGLFAAAMGGAFELSHGTLGEAQRRLAQLIALADPDNRYDTASRAMLESLTGVFTGDAQRALAHAPRAVELIDRMGSVMHRMGYRIPLVWAYTQLGREAEARHWIASVRAIQDETGTRFWEPLLAIAEAQLAKPRGEAQSKQERLGHALTVARIERCDHVFGRFRRWVGEPLSDALAAQIEPAHAKHLVRRYSIPAPREPCEDWPWRVKVYALGGFRVLVDGEALGFSRKQPKKPLALLKGLIALGGSGVPQARVQDALWPSEEGDSAHAACRMAVRRLRALLGEQELVSAQAGLLGLDLQRVWVDALEFERLVDDGAPFARLDALYRGVFLAQDLEAAWALPARQRLQRRFTQQLSAEARRREQAGDYEGAIALYQRGIEMDEVAEALYQGLMRCHLQRGTAAEVRSAYYRLRRNLSNNLGVAPSRDSDALLRRAAGP